MENVRSCHPIGSVQTAVAAALKQNRSKARTTAADRHSQDLSCGSNYERENPRAKKHPIGLVPPTAVPTNDKRLMQWMVTPELGALAN